MGDTSKELQQSQTSLQSLKPKFTLDLTQVRPDNENDIATNTDYHDHKATDSEQEDYNYNDDNEEGGGSLVADQSSGLLTDVPSKNKECRGDNNRDNNSVTKVI